MMRTKVFTKMVLTGVLVASSAVGLTACGDSTSKGGGRAYFITPDITSSFVGLIGRTAAMVGRHTAVPDSLDLAAPPLACPNAPATGGQKGVNLQLQGCAKDAAGDTVCSIAESYDCTFVSGAISNTTVVETAGVSVSLSLTDYVEGNLAAGSNEAEYNGSVAIKTTPTLITYSEDQHIIGRTKGEGETEPTITDITAKGEYSLAVSTTDVMMTGTVEYQVVGVGLVKATIKDLKFDPTADCAGPIEGSIAVEIVGIESADINYTACDTFDLINDGGAQSQTIANNEEFALSMAEILMMQGTAGFNAMPTTDSVYGEATTTDPTSKQTWCRFFADPTGNLLGDPINLATPKTAAEGGGPLGECVTFAPGKDQANNPIIGFVATVLQFNSDQVTLLSASTGGTALDTSTGVLGVQPAYAIAAGSSIATQADLEAALLAWGQEQARAAAVPEAPNLALNPFTTAAVNTQAGYAVELNHMGLWLTNAADTTKAAFYTRIK